MHISRDFLSLSALQSPVLSSGASRPVRLLTSEDTGATRVSGMLGPAANGILDQALCLITGLQCCLLLATILSLLVHCQSITEMLVCSKCILCTSP